MKKHFASILLLCTVFMAAGAAPSLVSPPVDDLAQVKASFSDLKPEAVTLVAVEEALVFEANHGQECTVEILKADVKATDFTSVELNHSLRWCTQKETKDYRTKTPSYHNKAARIRADS